MPGTVEAWGEYNVAMAGASAALAGLVIVAASVNISQIIQARALTARLAGAIATLVLTLVVSAVGLIPVIDLRVYGLVILVSTTAAGVFQMNAARRIMGDRPALRSALGKISLVFLPIIAYLAAAIAMLTGHDGGLLFTAVGSLVAMVIAILVSWIALVEVLR